MKSSIECASELRNGYIPRQIGKGEVCKTCMIANVLQLVESVVVAALMSWNAVNLERRFCLSNGACSIVLHGGAGGSICL